MLGDSILLKFLIIPDYTESNKFPYLQNVKVVSFSSCIEIESIIFEKPNISFDMLGTHVPAAAGICFIAPVTSPL